MELQWAIDTIGKLGPLAVAMAVFWVNRNQAIFQRELSTRAARVEDQKWRLALFDRREAALEGISQTITEFWIAGAVTSEGVGRVGDALKTAELVFEDVEKDAIEALLRKLLDWQALERRQDNYRDKKGSEDRFQQAIDKQFALETQLFEHFQTLPAQLKAATRVQEVSPLTARKSILDVRRRR